MPLKERISETTPTFRTEKLQFCLFPHSSHSCLLAGQALCLMLQGILGFPSDPNPALQLPSEAGQLWSCLQGEALGQPSADWGPGASLTVWFLTTRRWPWRSPSLLVGRGGLARPWPHTCPLHPEWTLRNSVASQPSSSFGGEASADLLTHEHPTSDLTFSSPETAESPEDSPSMLLLPVYQAGAVGVLVSGAGSAWRFWVQREKHSWVDTRSVPS